MLEIEEVKKEGPCQYDYGDHDKNKGLSLHPCGLGFILGFILRLEGLFFNGVVHLSPLLSSS
jgi:hypothetical protein